MPSVGDAGDGRFVLKKLLGEGGAGRVWLAEDRERPGLDLALKELTGPETTRHEDAFRREFATLACLRHPSLVEVDEFDISPDTGRTRFTLELVEGRDLIGAVRREGTEVLGALAVEALRALSFLHDLDLIHRDLKPSNLLVRDRPKLGCRLVVVDFGLALRVSDQPSEAFRPAGTIAYLAPEVLANRAASRRSDLYALGAVLLEAVTGRPPARWEPDERGIGAALAREPISVSTLPGGVPSGFDRWLRDLLAEDPERRPASASEALARLNEACGTDHPAETEVTRLARLLSGPPAERESSVRAIWEALEPEGEPRVVFLCGGPGSGKSRILRWLEAEAILRGCTVAKGIAHRRLSLEALRETAGRGKTVLLLDEVHAAGAEIVDVLTRTVREQAAAPLRIVATLRPGAIDRPALRALLEAAGTTPALSRIDLSDLDSGGIRAMAERATGGAVSGERVAWLLEASGGSPRIAEGLLVEGAWERGGRSRSRGTAAGLPHGRLRMISPEAMRWLEGVAVVRVGAREAHLASLSGLEARAARAVSEGASAAGLAYRASGLWHPESSSLADQLVSSLPASRRVALHRAAAELLESDPRADAEPALVARLWSGAAEGERAVAWYLRAAERSERLADPAGAANDYARALGAHRGRGPERHGLRRRQAEALVRAGMSAAAARAFGAAARVAPDAISRVEAKVSQAMALVQAGRIRLALAIAERAAAHAAASGSDALAARARQVLAIGLGRLGREGESLPVLEEACRLMRGAGDLRGEAEALHLLAVCRARLGDERAEVEFVEAIALYARAASAGLPAGDGQDLKARIGLAVLRATAGRYADAEASLAEVRADALARGNIGLQQLALSKLAIVAIDLGKLDRAMTLAEQAVDLALYLGDQNLILVSRCGLADARIRCGRAGEAVAALRQTLQMPLDNVDPENVDYARMLLADAWMESGGGEEASVRELLERSLERCRERRKPRAWRMALAIEMERRARPDCPEPFEPIRTEFEARRPEAGDEEATEIGIRARLASAAFRLARGEMEAARSEADLAARAARRIDYPAFEARAMALVAQVLERSGRDREAAAAADAGRGLLARAAERIADAAVRSDFLERPVYRALRAGPGSVSARSRSRLVALYDMVRALNSETDAESLLETILDLAMRAVAAQRGMVFLREDREGPGRGEFVVHASRNLETETERDALSYSRRILETAGAGRSLLALDAGTDERFRSLASVSLYDIRSLMCVPLRLRGRIIGTVYLDSRKEGELFTEDDLRFVEAFADQAALAIENARLRVALERQNRHLLAAAEARTSFASLVGRSPGVQAVFDLIDKVAATDLPVLIRGESGTGKELVARAIHFRGPRRRRPFLGENCAALPETLLESELFGHVRGAFTGAERDRPGLFEQADGGTLFLDEVGDMSAAMQSRLLRVLEEGKVRRVGGERALPVDVRIVAATHRDLSAEIKAGRFRQDLFYRLQVLSIEIPPLRERTGDVPLLVAHFLERIAAERQRPPWVVDEDALALFTRYHWPGNVRELQNALQRLSLLAGSRAISAALIASDPVLSRSLSRPAAGEKPAFSLASAERDQVRNALAASGGNRKAAAVLLGVSRATLYRKLARHRI